MNKSNWIGFVPFYLMVMIIFIGLAKGGSMAVDTINQSIPVTRQHCIVIDAGHGGIDGGATSCTGILESQLNLEISLRLNDLMHFLGYETVMIRTTDTSVYTKGETIAAQKVSDLKERVRIVNETDGAILVSIHQNTFSDSRYDGAQVFYGIDDKSHTLAQKLQTAFINSVNPESKRKCKTSKGIYLMEHIQKTGVLIECGFLSNPAEEAKLRNANYQQKICCVIASTLSEHLSNT